MASMVVRKGLNTAQILDKAKHRQVELFLGNAGGSRNYQQRQISDFGLAEQRDLLGKQETADRRVESRRDSGAAPQATSKLERPGLSPAS